MKITIESYKGEEEELIVSSEFVDGCDIHMVMEHISNLLVASGFHPHSVIDGFINRVEDLKDVEKPNKKT